MEQGPFSEANSSTARKENHNIQENEMFFAAFTTARHLCLF